MRTELRETAALGPAEAAARALLDAAFAGDFADEDWAHARGGLHALAWAEGALVGHASLVPRTLWVAGVAVGAGYVEAVAVHPAHQAAGVGTALMRALEPAMATHALCALSTGAHRFYARLGWRAWAGPTLVRTAAGLVRTPDEDDGIMVWWPPGAPGPDLRAALACRNRPGDAW